MPTDLQDAKPGNADLYFADDLEGTEFQLKEAVIYESDEVTEDGEMPEFGNWLPAIVDNREVWIVAVGELIEELQRYENPTGLQLQVTRCKKSGSRQTDPYEVNVEEVDPDQQSL